MHSRLGRYSINDIQGVVVVEGSDTSYADGGCSRRCSVSRDVHARYPALKSLDGIVLILLLGSVQLFCIGIIGEYVGRTFEQTKNRPIYIAKEILNYE